MIGADEITLILGKEMIIDPIQRDRNVAAAIDVREVIALVIQEQTLDDLSLAPEIKLLCHPMQKLSGPSHHFASTIFCFSISAHDVPLAG